MRAIVCNARPPTHPHLTHTYMHTLSCEHLLQTTRAALFFAAATVALFGVTSAIVVQLSTPPTQGNILVVSTNGTLAVLNEFGSAARAAPVQSLPIPGCFLAAVANEVYGSVTPTGYYALFPCGSTVSGTRYVARVNSAGSIDTRCAICCCCCRYFALLSPRAPRWVYFRCALHKSAHLRPHFAARRTLGARRTTRVALPVPMVSRSTMGTACLSTSANLARRRQQA